MNPIEMMLDGATWTPIETPAIGETLHATHSGVLTIGDVTMKCWRLSDGRAMIDAESMARFFGFNSPEELAKDLERLGNSELAATVRAPTSFQAE